MKDFLEEIKNSELIKKYSSEATAERASRAKRAVDEKKQLGDQEIIRQKKWLKGLMYYEISPKRDAVNKMPQKWIQIWLCENGHIHAWNPASCRNLDACPHCGKRNISFISVPFFSPERDIMVFRRKIVLLEKDPNPLLNRYKMIKTASTHYLFDSECEKCGKRTDLSWENGLCRQCDPDSINASPVDEARMPWRSISYYLCPNGHLNVFSFNRDFWWPSSSFREYTDGELSLCRYCHGKLNHDNWCIITPEQKSYKFQFVRTKLPTVNSHAEYKIQYMEAFIGYRIFKESHKKLPTGDFKIEYELPDETTESEEMMELIKKRELHGLNLVQTQQSQYPNGDEFFQFKIGIPNSKRFSNIFNFEVAGEATDK